MKDSEDTVPQPPSNTPYHSVAICPQCGAGLCGIRICDGDDPTEPAPIAGFILCDECEALWLEPNVEKAAQYLNHENPMCPISHAPLWNTSHWADTDEVHALGWSSHIDPALSR